MKASVYYHNYYFLGFFNYSQNYNNIYKNALLQNTQKCRYIYKWSIVKIIMNTGMQNIMMNFMTFCSSLWHHLLVIPFLSSKHWAQPNYRTFYTVYENRFHNNEHLSWEAVNGKGLICLHWTCPCGSCRWAQPTWWHTGLQIPPLPQRCPPLPCPASDP